MMMHTAFIQSYGASLALFFVENGIIISTSSSSNPLLPFATHVSLLKPQVESIHLCDDTIIVKCQLGIEKAQMSAAHLMVTPLRAFLTKASPELQMLILKALQWLNWDKQSRYCGQCGTLLESQFYVPEKKCSVCKLSLFPRFSPAIMVLIQREKQILLARSTHFTPGIYSAIAGFIEIGETAEMAAHREVREEVGIEIMNLTYFSSQNWPFPDCFMIAYTAQYAGGDLRMDPAELEDAAWFSLDALPILPSPPSIARQLIDSVLRNLT